MQKNGSFAIEDLRGKMRLVLIFAPSVKSPPFETQIRLLDGEGPAFESRNLAEIGVLSEGAGYVGEDSLNEDSAAALRRRFNIGDGDFLVVLIGMDGEELHRYDGPVQPEALYAELDRGSRGDVNEEVEPVGSPVHVKSDVEQ